SQEVSRGESGRDELSAPAYRITEDPEFNRMMRSIRCRTIEKLLLLSWNLFLAQNPELGLKVFEKIRTEKPEADLVDLVMALKAGDVAEYLGLKERQAYTYVDALRFIVGHSTFAGTRPTWMKVQTQHG